MKLCLLASAALLPVPALHPLPRAAPPRATLDDASSRGATSGRVTIGALAAAGALETGSLATDKLWGVGALQGFCAPGAGCGDVLNGPWAALPGGLPLAALGFAAYAAMALLAGAGASGDGADWADDALASGAGAMAAFSACLLTLLALVIREPCALCFGSAGLSGAMLLATWAAPLLPSRTETAVRSSAGALVGLLAAAALFWLGPTPVPADSEPPAPPLVRARSSPRALALARRMGALDAKYYGAYWCSHCADQKETLGREAMATVPYVECSPNGAGSQRAACLEAEVPGYPTWQLRGKLYPGERGLRELEEIVAELEAGRARD